MQPVATSPDKSNASPPVAPGPAPIASVSNGQRLRRHVARVFHDNPALYAVIGLLLLCIANVCLSTDFLTSKNLSNVLRQVSINAIIASGMTVVILTGGIDLSVG